MKKKILALLLVVVLILTTFSFAACDFGGSDWWSNLFGGGDDDYKFAEINYFDAKAARKNYEHKIIVEGDVVTFKIVDGVNPSLLSAGMAVDFPENHALRFDAEIVNCTFPPEVEFRLTLGVLASGFDDGFSTFVYIFSYGHGRLPVTTDFLFRYDYFKITGYRFSVNPVQNSDWYDTYIQLKDIKITAVK